LSKTIQNSLNYKKYVVDSKLQYFKPNSAKIEKSFADEVSFSLTQNSKFINPKFFYDKKALTYLKRYVIYLNTIPLEQKLTSSKI